MYRQFLSAFYEAYHYKEGERIQTKLNDELTMEYPFALIKIDGAAVVLLCPELEDAVGEVEEAFGDGITVQRLAAFLFEPEVSFTFERVYGCYHPLKQKLPYDERIRMLVRSDAFELSRLLKSCPKDEREAGKVTLRDEIVIGLFEEDVLLGAAGGVRVGDLMDLSVIVAPSARKQGIACALLSHLCMLCADRELIPHYRYEAQNIASHQLRKKVGFKRAYSMTGAQAIYPAE